MVTVPANVDDAVQCWGTFSKKHHKPTSFRLGIGIDAHAGVELPIVQTGGGHHSGSLPWGAGAQSGWTERGRTDP